MARDYKNIKKRKPPLRERFSHALSFLTGLSLGLFVAVIVYFNEHSADIEVNNALLTDTGKADAPREDGRGAAPAEQVKPEFEFYHILLGKEVNISEWESAEETPVRQDSPEPGLFVLQVGSFKEYGAADQVKAQLALVGVKADIQRVVINGQDVRHRVRVGPYSNDSKLQQVKERLSANDLDFMLLRLKREEI